MKNPSKILLPSEYEPLGADLPGVRARLDNYEDLVPYFPVIHLDEVGKDGKLSDTEGFNTRGFTVGQDFSICGGFNMDTPDLRYYAQDSGDALHRSLSGVLSMLRFGERLQFQWMVQDVMDPVYRRYLDLKPDDLPFLKFTRKKRYDDFIRRFEDGTMRHFTAAGFLQVPYGGKVMDLPAEGGLVGKVVGGLGAFFSGVFSAIGTSAKSVHGRELMTHLDVWRNRVDTLQRALSAVPGILLSPVHSSDYIQWYRRLLSPDLWDRMRASGVFKTGYDNLVSAASVGAQCLTGRVRDRSSYFVTGSHYHRILTIEIPPTFVEMGFLMRAITLREVLESLRNIQVTLNMTPRSREKELAGLRRRRDLMVKIHKENMKKGNTELTPVIDQLNNEISILSNNDISQLFSAVLVVHLWDNDRNRLSTAEEVLVSKLRSITSAVLAGEDLAALPYFLDYCLPGCPGKGDRHRQLPMRNDELAPLVPLLGRGTGIIAKTPEPLVPTLFGTDLGTPFSVDFFARHMVSTYNSIVVGGSGSGKSFLFNHMVSSYGMKKAKTRVIVIDAAVGTPSFKAMCHLMGGNYVDKGFRFNALGTHVENGVVMSPDEEEMTGIMSTLEAILRPSETENFTSAQRSFLTACVTYLFENRPEDGVPYLRHLPQAVENYMRSIPEGSDFRRFAEQIIQVLKASWTFPGGSNVNARYVDGADDAMDSWLTVFDLKWVLGRRDLLTVFMTLIFRHMFRLEAENNRKPDTEREKIIVVVDEGWKVLFDQAFAGMVTGLYKAGRSRNMSTNLLTQDFSDFKVFLKKMMGGGSEDPKSSPIITQSSHFFVANLDVKEAQELGETLNLPVPQWEALSRLKREDGKFSEYGYFCRVLGSPELLFSKLRYSPLPEELWAFTSNSEDDGRRLRIMDEVKAELRSSGSRETFLSEMASAGWDRDSLGALDEDAFVRHVAVFKLAKGK